MQEKSDTQLLRDYAEHGQEAAFRELVTRYTDLVYSAAFRQVETADIAADITQRIFVDLARKARPVSERLAGHKSLAGWLHRSTRFLALNHLRDTHRRVTNERQAMEQLLTDSESAPDWELIRPVLDEALDDLADEDRDAVLLRYFKNHDLRTVGATLGISDDAAQKRVSRAVERLREFFAKRGATVGASGLAVVISANAVQAAPVGLALTISTAAALTGTTLVTTAAISTTKAIVMTTFQKAAVATTVAVLTGVGIYEARQAVQLRDQVRAAQEQQSPLNEQIDQLQRERDLATNHLANLSEELARAKNNNADLLKLRGEVGLLRRQTNHLGNLLQAAEKKSAPNNATNANAELDASNDVIRRESYEFAGYASPQATIKSLFWAGTKGDPQTLLASLSPAMKTQTEAEWAGRSEEDVRADLLKQDSENTVTGFRVTDVLKVAENEVVLTIFLEGRNRENKMRLVRVNDEWKIAGKPGR